MTKAAWFWPYGLKAVKCWAIEAQAGRLRIAGAIVVLMVFQVAILPMELYRMIWQRRQRRLIAKR